MTMTNDQISKAIENLADARARVADAATYRANLEAEIDALVQEHYGKDLALLKEVEDAASAWLDKADSDVRNLAFEQFAQTSDKRPHPAVQIKEFTVLVYEEAQALEFCRTSAPKALKLDKRAFEKIAKVGKEAGGPFSLDFVTVTTEPRVTVASDLSAWLPTEGETDASTIHTSD